MVIEIIAPILQTGAVGAMLIMTWRLMVNKDRKSYQMIEAQNEERRTMYKNMEELVKEVTSALVYKNVTDDKMAGALEKLTTSLQSIQAQLGIKKNETSPPTV
jgi:uncharacterized coiled-coil protein SlyX